MTTIEQVYDALAARLRTIPGMRAKEYVPGDTEFPVAFPEPPAVETDNLADDTLTLTFDLVVLVDTFEHRHARKLLKYQEPAGTHSVMAAVKSDPTLGLGEVNVIAGAWRPLGLQEMSYYRAFGAACAVTVLLGD